MRLTETIWQRLVYGVRRLRQRADWEAFAGPDWANHILAVPVTDRFHAKEGRSTGRWIIHAGGRRLGVYLKRHYRLPWWHGLLAALWPDAGWSPAFQEWRNLEWARGQGLPVPAAVAAGEFIGPWGRLQSVLAVEELRDMLPLHEAVPAAAARLSRATFGRWKRGLAVELARLARELHACRRFHKDLYLCHFYILAADTEHVPAGWHGRVHVIDLHRLAHYPWTWWLWQAKDLGQLLYSSDVQGIGVRDRLRFWKAYLRTEHQTWAAWVLRWVILCKWRLYRRHNLKRRRKAARKRQAA
jgi:heptose I phosphotransferase